MIEGRDGFPSEAVVTIDEIRSIRVKGDGSGLSITLNVTKDGLKDTGHWSGLLADGSKLEGAVKVDRFPVIDRREKAKTPLQRPPAAAGGGPAEEK